MSRPACLSLLLLGSSPAWAGDADPLARAGTDHAVERLVAIREIAQSRDPQALPVLAAAYARLEADPKGGFSVPEKVALLRALGAFAGRRDIPDRGVGGPCACRALADPSPEVRQAGLNLLQELRHPQAAPALIALLETAEAVDPIASQAGRLLETLTNHSCHFEALAEAGERQIAVARWRQWWEAHRDLPRGAWQQEGFRDAGIAVALPLAAEGVPALLEALSGSKPAWVRENALEILSALPCPAAKAKKIEDPACVALAKGLTHEDPKVQGRAALALCRLLSSGGAADLPVPPPELFHVLEGAQKDDPAVRTFLKGMQAWWALHA